MGKCIVRVFKIDSLIIVNISKNVTPHRMNSETTLHAWLTNSRHVLSRKQVKNMKY